MPITSPRRESATGSLRRRTARFWSVIGASVAVIAASAFVAVPAQALPVGPPAWESIELGVLRVGVPFTAEISAVGDGPITYYTYEDSSLPPGVVLDDETGSLSGTPTTAGYFEFWLQAVNDFGDDVYLFSGTVLGATELHLVPDFAEGDSVSDATTTSSGGGLRPGSAFTLTLHSAPVVLHTGTVGSTGGFASVVSLLAGTPDGAHSLVLNGTAPNGSAVTSTVWFSVSNGKIAQLSLTGPVPDPDGSAAVASADPDGVSGRTALATTGADPDGTIGGGSLAVRRRRVAVWSIDPFGMTSA